MNKLIKKTIIIIVIFIILSSIFYVFYAKQKIRSNVALHAVHNFLKTTDDFQYIEGSWSSRDIVWGDRYTVVVRFIDEKDITYEFRYFWEYQSLVGSPYIMIKNEEIKDDMVPKHFENYQEAMAKTLATHDDYKSDILYEYSFNDYYKDVKLKGLIIEIFNINIINWKLSLSSPPIRKIKIKPCICKAFIVWKKLIFHIKFRIYLNTVFHSNSLICIHTLKRYI